MKNLSLSKIGSSFDRNAREFCRHPRQWMSLHGANLAGVLWNTGDGVQFLLGAVTLSPRIVASSLINVAASSSSMIFGKRDWGVALNSGLAILGTGVFLSPNLAAGDVRTCLGYAGFCAAVSFGIFSSRLSKQFAQGGNRFLHNTLGRPRRTMGAALFLSRMPIILSATLHGQWTIVAPFAVWSLGDLSMSLSREEIVTRPASAPDLVPSPR